MGSVFFDTDVNKTVDINKFVNLTVTKDVFSFVDLTGNLATAEASADAIGSGGGGGGEQCITREFLIDDLTFPQSVEQTDVGMNTDGPIPFSVTSIPSGLRELIVDVVQADPTTDAAIDIPVLGSSIGFSNDVGVVSNQDVVYTSEEGTFSILVDCPPDGTIDIGDLDSNLIQVEGVDLNAEDGTLRLEIAMIDGDGDRVDVAGYAVSQVYADNGGATDVNGDPLNAFANGQDINVPLALFAGGNAASAPADTELSDALPPTIGGNEGFYVVGIFDNFATGPGDGVMDFDDIDQLVFSVLGDISVSLVSPEGQAGGPGDPTEAESPGEPGTDVFIDNFKVFSECCIPDGDGGNLAETDTFAQVTENGAFSFSESLAAFDPFEIA